VQRTKSAVDEMVMDLCLNECLFTELKLFENNVSLNIVHFSYEFMGVILFFFV